MAEQWLSIVEYARAYKVSDMTIRRRIKTGKLQAVLQDGKYYIPIPAAAPPRPGGMPHVSHVPSAAAASLASPAHDGREFGGGGQRSSSGYGGELASVAPGSQQGHPRGMTIIKAHPAAQQTFGRAFAEPAAPALPFAAALPETERGGGGSFEAAEASIPQSLKRPLLSQETSLVDTRALLAFCEASMRKMTEVERRQVEKFKAKLETLEATLIARDQEVKALKQQLEDLQLLVRILERKK